MLSLSRATKSSLASTARRRVPVSVSPAAFVHTASRTQGLSPLAHSRRTPSITKSLSGVRNMSGLAESAERPEPDKVLVDIASYIHNHTDYSPLALETARLCLIDTIGCGLEALRFDHCRKLLGPVVEGTVVPNGELADFRNFRSARISDI